MCPRESTSTCGQTSQCTLRQLRVPALTLWLVRAEGQTDMPMIPSCFLLVMRNPPSAPCRCLCNHGTEGRPLFFQKTLPSFSAFAFSRFSLLDFHNFCVSLQGRKCRRQIDELGSKPCTCRVIPKPKSGTKHVAAVATQVKLLAEKLLHQ